MDKAKKTPIQPVSGTIVPRFAGPSTFARLPELRDVSRCDIAILGIPFDAGTSYRAGLDLVRNQSGRPHDIYELSIIRHMTLSPL